MGLYHYYSSQYNNKVATACDFVHVCSKYINDEVDDYGGLTVCIVDLEVPSLIPGMNNLGNSLSKLVFIWVFWVVFHSEIRCSSTKSTRDSLDWDQVVRVAVVIYCHHYIIINKLKMNTYQGRKHLIATKFIKITWLSKKKIKLSLV